MISSIRGTVLSVSGLAGTGIAGRCVAGSGVAGTTATAVLEVGGVGFAVQVTPGFAMSLNRGAEVSVHTALIVREDDLSLYGFEEIDELTVFNLLRSVTGVGPRSALGVLAVMRPADISLAVVTEDDAAFRRVSGIGPKTAKLIVLTLAGKVTIAPRSDTSVAAVATSLTQDVVVALVGLGWPERLAITAVDEAAANASEVDAASVSALLRLALAQLGPRSRVSDTQ